MKASANRIEMIQGELKAVEEIARIKRELIEKKLALRRKKLECMNQNIESEKKTDEENDDVKMITKNNKEAVQKWVNESCENKGV